MNLVSYLEKLAEAMLDRGDEELAIYIEQTRVDYIYGRVNLAEAQNVANLARRVLA